MTPTSLRSTQCIHSQEKILPKQEKIVVVMPAYNAARTLKFTFNSIDTQLVDEIILVDDHSQDDTVAIAEKLDLQVIRHSRNLGYGGNQKTCYQEALRVGADIVVMLHPDGQYDPTLIPEIIKPIQEQKADLVLGSRMIHPRKALAGGMPLYKFIANKFLTFCENLILSQNLSEYHTGYRAYSRKFLEKVPFLRNSNGYVFDTEILVQAIAFKQRIAEITISTSYFDGASSASFWQSIVYGFKTLGTLYKYFLHRLNVSSCYLFIR